MITIDLDRSYKMQLLKKVKKDLITLNSNIKKSKKVPTVNKRLAENIIITINDVWQKENERIKLLESCEKEEVLKVVTEEDEQQKDSPKGDVQSSLKLKSPEAE